MVRITNPGITTETFTRMVSLKIKDHGLSVNHVMIMPETIGTNLKSVGLNMGGLRGLIKSLSRNLML